MSSSQSSPQRKENCPDEYQHNCRSPHYSPIYMCFPHEKQRVHAPPDNDDEKPARPQYAHPHHDTKSAQRLKKPGSWLKIQQHIVFAIASSRLSVLYFLLVYYNIGLKSRPRMANTTGDSLSCKNKCFKEHSCITDSFYSFSISTAKIPTHVWSCRGFITMRSLSVRSGSAGCTVLKLSASVLYWSVL